MFKKNSKESYKSIEGCLFVYKQNNKIEFVKKVQIFNNGTSIHEIETDISTEKLLLAGETRISCYESVFTNNSFKNIYSTTIKDWILATKWLKKDNIALVLMHNIVIILNNELVQIREFISEEKCILYSAFISIKEEEVVILAGTVCSEILVWKPQNCSVCKVSKKLIGHKGVIFSIHYNESAGFICSSSDDRSTILWQVASKSLHSDTNSEIILKCKVFGHSSRIFRCLMLESCFISAGEDSIINIWDINGHLERKIEAHQGGCIWALDANSKLIVSGGGDSAVTIFPLNNQVNREYFEIAKRAPKCIAILKSGNIVGINDDGSLFYYNQKTKNIHEIALLKQFSAYCLLEVSHCRKMAALAGYSGEVQIYSETNDSLELIVDYKSVNESRIVAFHWLNCVSFLACENGGKLTLFHRKNAILNEVFRFNLPKSSSSTSACQIKTGKYIIGDRKGALHLFELGVSNPIQSVKRAHNYLGVTQITMLKNSIFSLGRNGIVQKIAMGNKMRVVSRDKVPFTWLARFVDNLLLAFSGSHFVLWDYENRAVLFEENCGGGHRSWDFHQSGGKIQFAYVKDKIVWVLTAAHQSIMPKSLIPGYHFKEINGLRAIKGAQDEYYVISGGEDTSLRVSRVFNDTFSNLVNLKAHLSNIRCISIVKLSESTFLVFSGGGRQQIVYWRLELDAEDTFCSEINSFNEKKSLDDSEIRIMDMATLLVDELRVFAACSDGNINIFKVNCENKIYLVNSLFYKRKCVTKIQVLTIYEYIVLISMATDGNIVFWTISDDNQGRICGSFQAHQSGINTCSYFHVTNDKVAFLTGGDDNAIVLNLFHISNTNGKLNFIKIDHFYDIGTHCAQITGSFINQNYFLTCAIDQRLSIFRWSCTDGFINECKMVNKYVTSVPDCQGIECFDYEDYFDVFIYGKGFDFVKCIKK